MWTLILVIVGLVFLRVIFIYYYQEYLQWENKNRSGLTYFSKTFAEKKAFKENLQLNARLLIPFLKFESKIKKRFFKIPSFSYQDVYGPLGTCSPEQFESASQYQPQGTDVFVVSQMRSGTTWLRQIAFEILSEGNGDLSDDGYKHIDAVSPWIESNFGVNFADAPVLPGNKKLIKTHLPVNLCPYSEEAKYLYIARHPLSCFSSVVDFFHLMTGFQSPPESELADWFCSPKMWWSSWPEHVVGWWNLAQEKKNIHWVYFEDLKKNPKDEIVRIAHFLGKELSDQSLEKVLTKSSFEYMKSNEERFDMSPPNLYSVSGTFFRSGDRQSSEASPEMKNKILQFCREGLKSSDFSQNVIYEDLKGVQSVI